MDADNGTAAGANDQSSESRSFLQRLITHLQDSEQISSESPVSVPMGRAKVQVTAEELELIRSLVGDGEPKNELQRLILDAIDLKVRFLANAKALADAEAKDGEAHGSAAEGVREAVETGHGDLEHLAAEFNVLVAGKRGMGETTEANRIDAYRRRLLAVVSDAEQTYPGLKLSDDSADAKRYEQDYDPRAAARAKAKLTDRPEGESKKKPKKAGLRKAALMAVAAALVGVVIGVGIVYMQNRQPDLPDFSVADFKQIPGVETVIKRSPGILVIVSDSSWDAMKPEDRTGAMEYLVATVKPAGYSRAEIRSSMRQELALWKGGKIEVH